jgi:hypothetical protein
LVVNVQPFTPLVMSGLAMVGGQFEFQVTGAIGWNYTVQASTNLTAWTNVLTTNPAALPFNWMDAGATNLPRRFYRVLLTP